MNIDNAPPRLQDNEAELWAYTDRLLREFPFFLAETLKLIPPYRLVPHWVQLDIADWMQHAPPRAITLAPRGISKTWIASIFGLWGLFRDPQDRVAMISKSKDHALNATTFARGLIDTTWFLQHLEPEKDQKDAGGAFFVSGAARLPTPSFGAYGFGGQITGSRARLLIADDVETLENTITLLNRKRIRVRCAEFENMVRPPEEGGQIMYIGTRHHEESIYDEYVANGYTPRAWPARALLSDDDDPGNGVPYLSPTVSRKIRSGELTIGKSLWPEVFSDEYLLSQENGIMGRSGFAMQWLMLPLRADNLRYPLRLSDLIVYEQMDRDIAPVDIKWGRTNNHGAPTSTGIDHAGFDGDELLGPFYIDPQLEPYTHTIAFIDPAGRGRDKTGIAIVGHLAGRFFVKHLSGLDGGFEDHQCDAIAELLHAHGATRFAVEAQFGGEEKARLIEQAVQRLRARLEADPTLRLGPPSPSIWNCGGETVPAHGQKELRIIAALEPAMNAHRIVVSRQVATNQDFQQQLTHLTRERDCLGGRGFRDDELDALAGAVAFLKHCMGINPQAALKNARETEAARWRAKRERWLRIQEREPRWIEPVPGQG